MEWCFSVVWLHHVQYFSKVWKPVYAASRAKYAHLDLTYHGVGSGAGIKGLQENLYDYAGSDVILNEDVHSKYPDFYSFPSMAVYVRQMYLMDSDAKYLFSLGNFSCKKIPPR